MTTSNLASKVFNSRRLKKFFQARLARLLLLGITTLFVVTFSTCLTGNQPIEQFSNQLHSLQENSLIWLEVPKGMGNYLLTPTVVLFAIAVTIKKVSPQPQNWSRVLVVGILFGLTIRYILWRSLSTLNFADPINGFFSLGLFFMEMLVVFTSILQLFLMLRSKDRRHEANQYSRQVVNGSFCPSVDIFIPTYNEPIFILRRTLIGCQAINYSNKKIFLLDDTKRPEVKQLAQELGCGYIGRYKNSHAKAGNLNNAISKVSGELIVVFDADFVPTKDFLDRTVGFFQNKKVALVQTPQSFYNVDPIANNLGLGNIITPEEEVFYRQIQPIRDAADGVLCSGTSFVVRRSALMEVGCFFTESISEDYFTGIRLSAKGHRLVYLNEKLSAGLAADNISTHAVQRLRWARGTLQAFFVKANPLTIPGLRPLQRLAHLEGLLHWFSSIPRVVFLMMPLVYSFVGIIPLRATGAELVYFFLPYYLVQLTVFSWLNYRSRSALLSDIYSIILAFPLAITVIQVILNPFSKRFKVTPKGTLKNRFYFNWKLASPLIILFIATLLSLGKNLHSCLVQGGWIATMTPEIDQQFNGLGLGAIWSVYNLVMIGIALLALVDVPKLDVYEWFELRRVVKLNCAGKTWWGVTTSISKAGAEIALTQGGLPEIAQGETLPAVVEILEEGMMLQGQISITGFSGEFPAARVMFEQLTLSQQRCLVEMLYCRPGQWKRQNTPGELRSLWLLLKILLRPRVLFDRKQNAIAQESRSAVTVSQI
ncbi:glycosyltransferase [Lyngbya aestuarii]|uniref:glycosyltransferase n=1 Tax=Lyngbya aestuarii TaxID=118322 RepID=UPI00403D8974